MLNWMGEVAFRCYLAVYLGYNIVTDWARART